MPGKNKYVLDTMVFLSGTGLSAGDELFTVPGVLSELKGERDRARFEYFRDSGMKILEPGGELLNEVRQKSTVTGDSERLSEVDTALIALALELNAVLITDDYSIQNLADEMGVKYRPLSEGGIQKKFQWELKCTGCGRIWEEKHTECPVCGKPVRTKMKHKKELSRSARS